MANKAQLLALAGKRVYETVPLPEPYGPLRLRTLTAAESIAVTNYLYDDKGQLVPGREEYAGAKRLTLAIVDDAGNPLFGEEDVAAISTWADAIVDLLMRTLRKMGSAEYVETYLKNLSPAA